MLSRYLIIAVAGAALAVSGDAADSPVTSQTKSSKVATSPAAPIAPAVPSPAPGTAPAIRTPLAPAAPTTATTPPPPTSPLEPSFSPGGRRNKGQLSETQRGLMAEMREKYDKNKDGQLDAVERKSMSAEDRELMVRALAPQPRRNRAREAN